MESGTALDAMVTQLQEQGFGVSDSFIADKAITQLRACADLRAIRGEFAPAAIGVGQRRQQRTEIRGDHICWLHEPLFPSERDAMQLLEQLRLRLNQTLLLGLFDTELHYASYRPGAAYARHVDQPVGTMQRTVSFVLYLNLDWNPQAGGELRLYDAGRPAHDIEPRGGRLVCFLSAGREHEVLKAVRTRLALCGWFRIRD